MIPRVLTICTIATIAVTLAWSVVMRYARVRDARDLASQDDARMARAGRP